MAVIEVVVVRPFLDTAALDGEIMVKWSAMDARDE